MRRAEADEGEDSYYDEESDGGDDDESDKEDDEAQNDQTMQSNAGDGAESTTQASTLAN